MNTVLLLLLESVTNQATGVALVDEQLSRSVLSGNRFELTGVFVNAP